MYKLLILKVFSIALLLAFGAAAGGWENAKNTADDVIYEDKDRTFYCGCEYTSHGDTDGSGDVSHTACGYTGPSTHSGRADRIEWEHVVPASLMPARQFPCWVNGNRQQCEDTDPRAQAMLFDLHNLAPSVGQVNALRSNDRYTDLPDVTSDFGSCPIEDTTNAFEPPDCLKGNVARIWFYMELRHGVEIASDERTMFEAWAAADPVSPWESEREERIAKHTFVVNPFVRDMPTDASGACPWE
jgi:deoxyribonuclease-1